MAKRGVVRCSPLPSCLGVWTLVALLEVVAGRQVDDFRATVTPKSPKTCGPRPDYCLVTASSFHMPWSCPPQVNSSCYANYGYRFDSSSGEKSKFSANLSATIFYRYPERGNPMSGCFQVLNLTWTVRLNDSDLPIAGFKLVYNRFAPHKNVNKSDEVLFFIEQEKLPVDKNGNTVFYFDCLRLSMATQYRFELFSLHSPSDRVPERLARSIGVTNLRTDCDMYPDGHFTSVSKYEGFINVSQVDRDCNSIIVYFSPAPDSFGFGGYNVDLLLNDKEIATAKNLSYKCDNYEPVFFNNVGSGKYRLMVTPVGGRCPCANCKACSAPYIDFNISASNYVCQTTTALPPVSDLTHSQIPSAPSEGKSMISESPVSIRNQTVMITVVTITVAAVAVLTIIMVVFKSRKCKGQTTVSTDIDSNDEKDELIREPVVLIYASDNCYHNNVVRRLATYLQTHCHCDVRFDQWSQKEISEVSALDWILHQLRSVKNVIVINSEGGFRHYEAFMRGVAYEKIEHETPLENMFSPAMQELRNGYYLKPKSRKVFKVAFPYTDSEFIINDIHPGITYRLMTHIEDLCLNIHGLSKHSRRGKTTVLGINQRDYTKSPEGHELEKAIREACEYGKGHPNWFSNFYQEKPRKDRNKVCSSMNKDWNEGCLALQNGSPWNEGCLALQNCSPWNEGCLALQSGSPCIPSPVYDSGIGTSIECQNVSDSFLKMLCSENQQMEVFQAPDLDDVSSVSSTNLELKGEMFNKDFDSTLEPFLTFLPNDFVLTERL